ncbi:MAG: phosphoribosylamine--glycine ligase [Defluviitaleaceae bacterium]|nr:phosphoribosylamine--glycine ligase [Defluviitaleaceae bacterium]
MAKVLVVGKGGREHALAWKLAQSPQVDKVYVAPGNPGMADVATPVDISETDFDGLVNFAKSEGIALTVIGPDQQVADGIVDRFQAAGLAVWGPTAKAARIESSKTFAKDLMKKYGIPTAAYEIFTNYPDACAYIETAKMPVVIKADGLAAGKGVVIPATVAEAKEALREMMEDSKFGSAGNTVVIEEFLEGEEFSFMAFVMGDKVYPMALARDHKRAYDGDKGANTGGMGAFSPVPFISQAIVKEAIAETLQKTADAMVAESCPFTGFLFGGLIATPASVKVIEFNARFGDPEAEVLLPRLDGDLYEILQTLLAGGEPQFGWTEDVCIGVILASEGYPEAPITGYPITGLDDLDGETLVFHCGTAVKDGKTVTNGGRVLMLVRKAKDFATARADVYKEVTKIKCDKLFHRTDIGVRAND